MAARSAARTRRLIRPQRWQSDSIRGLSPFQHSGHRLTGCRVRATDRAADTTSCKNGDGLLGSLKRPQAGAFDFLHILVTFCENYSDAELYGRNESIFTHFFQISTTNIKLNGFHLRFRRTLLFALELHHAKMRRVRQFLTC